VESVVGTPLSRPGTAARRDPLRARLRPAAAAVVLLVLAAVVRLLLVAPVAVSGDSMEPTVRDGAVAFVALRTDVEELRRCDLVVFRDPEGALSLKRVVALGGDDVVILDAVLMLNGRPVDEPYVDARTVDGLFTPSVSVPEGELYLLGDNRSRSVDSLAYGTISAEQVVGRVLWTW
jgi:signal peptidase I